MHVINVKFFEKGVFNKTLTVNRIKITLPQDKSRLSDNHASSKIFYHGQRRMQDLYGNQSNTFQFYVIPKNIIKSTSFCELKNHRFRHNIRVHHF